MSGEPSDIQALLQEQPLHWYDFICPFCYVGQHRSALLEKQGLHVTELPFQAHPEIPAAGLLMGPRTGPMYQLLEREAKAADLLINWPAKLSNTRYALTVAEWVRRHQPAIFSGLQRDLFAAHFVRGEDLGSHDVVDRYAEERGANLKKIRAAVEDGSASSALADSEALGRSVGVSSTPAWLVNGQLLVGLRPVAEFASLTATYAGEQGGMQCKL